MSRGQHLTRRPPPPSSPWRLRPIIPWHGWLPGKRLRPDYGLLGGVRIDAFDVGLALHRVRSLLATGPDCVHAVCLQAHIC